MSLSFLTLGVGDAFSALRYSSCLAVEAEGQVLLIDCPHPIRKMMREASESSGVPLDADRVAGVALTHLHADHSSGLEGLGYSPDTAFDEGLIAWLAEADLVVHETNYGVHTPYAKLAALPAELRARMRLIHYPDDFDTGTSVIEPLAQGRRYTV